jgi:hypothetical protein
MQIYDIVPEKPITTQFLAGVARLRIFHALS